MKGFWAITYLLAGLSLSLSPALAIDPPFSLPPPERLARLQTLDLQTRHGTIRFRLLPKAAPWHVANMKFLADKGFYDNLTFHIVHQDYVLQAGAPDPAIPGSGPGYDLPPEFNHVVHTKGVIGMARLPDSVNPERRSHGSQFHILLADNPAMDRNFTAFGECIGNCELLSAIRKGDTIEKLAVYVR